MKIHTRLIMSAAIAVAVIFVLAAVAFFGMSRMGKLQDSGFHTTLNSGTANNNAYIGARMYSVIADSLINRDLVTSKKDWAEIKAESIKQIEEVALLADTAEEKDAVNTAKTALNTYIDLYEKQFLPMIEATAEDQLTRELRDIDGKVDEQKVIIEENLMKVSASMKNEAIQSDESFDATRQSTIYWFVFIGFIASFGLGFVSWKIIQSIEKSLGGDPDEISNVAKSMAEGNLDMNIALQSNDNYSAMYSLRTMQASIKALVNDAAALSQAAVEGKLATRADASKHQGDFRKVVAGVNATLDSVINPLNVAAEYVERISKGDIPNKITDSYNGDFNTIKNNLNDCIEAVNRMAADANMLSQAAVEGKLSTRADASKHQGDFRKIVEGVNATLDAVIGPLNVAAGYVDNFAKGNIPSKITDQYNGDFNVLKDNLNACIAALNLLVTDANMLAQAAKDDRLDTRADATKHWGDYRKVVEGVNGTLDTVMQKNAADAAVKAKEAQVLSDAVAESQEVIEGAKAGDLTSRVSLNGKTGAIASLCDGINALMDKMTEVVVQVREAGETINTAAGEISSGNTDLSQRTEQQASSLEQTASSMEELASTVKQNSENAKQANQLAVAASGVAVKGGDVVGQVVNTMSAINSSAKKIEDIISVIDGIAFQTNILALNAAVEAARAGEQGRGFAVVAGEVRNLAQRSASAAKEIKELITDSVSKTAEGTLQVETAGKTMQEIVSSVQRVTDIMGEITAASVEQSAGIDLVNDAITKMDEATQQNAALVEEAAAAAESLVEQSTSLMDTVNQFRLGGANNNSRAVSKGKPALRTVVQRSPNRPLSKPEPVKAITAKTGTNDNEWEEF